MVADTVRISVYMYHRMMLLHGRFAGTQRHRQQRKQLLTRGQTLDGYVAWPFLCMATALRLKTSDCAYRIVGLVSVRFWRRQRLA